MVQQVVDGVVDEVLGLFAEHGGHTYSERVTMEQHGLQAAARARAAGGSDALVLAALLHDVGHFLDAPDSEFGVTDHGTTGGAWLAERFVDAVCEPVRLHVAAKRYLCHVDPGYEDRLSPASVGTLRLQGGAMDAAEAAAFEAEPFRDDALTVRSFDDGGKVDGIDVPGLEAYRPLFGDPALRRTTVAVRTVADEVVTVDLDGTPTRFHALWLRDNARDDASRHAANDQRLFDVSDLPDRVTVEAAEVVGGRLHVTFGPDRSTSTFDASWLAAHRYDPPADAPGPARPWGRDDLDLQRVDITAARADVGPVSAALTADGLAVVTGLDVAGATIEDVVGLWGPIRETNYGRIFHVRAEENPVNLAFTPRALNVHTDNPYRRPVPGYQLLHCLTASDTGGVTVLVDGFRAVEMLSDEHPEAYATLTTRWVPFRWADDTFELTDRGPLIEVDDRGRLRAVRYNNRSAAPADVPFDEMAGFYDAYRTFADLLHRSELEVRFTLAPGECLVFDNERVLHGREGESDPGRYLQGCYVDRDWIHGRR